MLQYKRPCSQSHPSDKDQVVTNQSLMAIGLRHRSWYSFLPLWRLVPRTFNLETVQPCLTTHHNSSWISIPTVSNFSKQQLNDFGYSQQLAYSWNQINSQKREKNAYMKKTSWFFPPNFNHCNIYFHQKTNWMSNSSF